MSKKILVIGSADIDLMLNMRRMPAPGEILTDDAPYCMIPGGRAADAAVALAHLGAETVFCTRLGADSHGQRLVGLYREAGIDTRFIGVDKTHNTGFHVIMTENDGTTRAVSYPGANLYISRNDIEDTILSYPDGLYLQFDMPFETVRSAADFAHGRGIPVFMDASPAYGDLPLENLPPVEIFSPNEEEAKALTGVETLGMDSCLRVGLELSRRIKAKYYVLKLGNRGAFVYDGRFCHMCGAYPTRKPVDTAGAGVAFTTAMSLEYLRNGGNILDACRYANAVGAMTIQRPGSASSVPTHDEVVAFMKTHPAP